MDSFRLSGQYIQSGIQLMEIAARAHALFTTTMTAAEKREVVDLPLSNPRIEHGTVCFEYKKPFALMVNVKGFEEWLGN